MYARDDVIDSKYVVEGICSESGGMGALLFVRTVSGSKSTKRLVLKYCRDSSEEVLARFRREVRLLKSFAGSGRVVQLVDANPEHAPPYLVMEYYPDGDLTRRIEELRSDYELQERVFGEMIDCVDEMHSRDRYHRDIKPQNFLQTPGGGIVISDLGLSYELESRTALTRSSAYWGTQGYLPPEFQRGGFKNADATGDIFMLGKSFYVLLTGRDPLYLLADDVPEPLFHVIERCCEIQKEARYQSLTDLRQSLSAAFDVLLGRNGGVGKVRRMLERIVERLDQENQYQVAEIKEFLELLCLLEPDDRVPICFSLDARLFWILGQAPFQNRVAEFLRVYREMVEKASYGWHYAETIATCMERMFDSKAVKNSEKATALDIAIYAAIKEHRFAAMDTCTAMIVGIADERLGMLVRDILRKYPDTFIAKMDKSKCKSDAVRRALEELATP